MPARIFIIIISVFLVFVNLAVAETPSDYFPLQVGLEWNYHTDTSIHSQWSQRSAVFQVTGTDDISGEDYYRRIEKEVIDGSLEEHLYNVMWFGVDLNDNVILKAFCAEPVIEDIDSAIILDEPSVYLSSDMFGLGNTWTNNFDMFDISEHLEVTGVGEQISVPAGTFDNCITLKNVTTNLSGIDTSFIVYISYAPGVGIVTHETVYPAERHNKLELISYPCCVGFTGNVDCSQDENPDITDITRLIDFLYLSHAPLCCPDEADCDGSGGDPDITDITRIIDYLYLSHNPLYPCP